MTQEIEIRRPSGRHVPGLLLRPSDARALYLFAHGAGAGMTHRAMEGMATLLADRGVATLRYEFPYMAEGRRRPDPPNRLLATVRAAAGRAAELGEGLPIVAGGRSMGGRMTSLAESREHLEGVSALAFLAFPLHPSKKPGIERADHLDSVSLPMLFVQGTRDALARLELFDEVWQRLGALAHTKIVEDADHSFHVLKRTGKSQQQVDEEIADSLVSWIDGLRK